MLDKSMLPVLWGNHTWYLLHILVAKPISNIHEYHTLFYYLQYMLPCEKCRNNYRQHLLALPIPNTKRNLSEWLINVHNRVNLSIHKPIMNIYEMRSFWNRQYETIQDISETRLFDSFEYILESHPGGRKVTYDTISGHTQFWTIVPNMLTSIRGSEKLKQYINENPLTESTIKYKRRYQRWYQSLKKHMNIRVTRNMIRCNSYCKV